jgi:hypothetical protein
VLNDSQLVALSNDIAFHIEPVITDALNKGDNNAIVDWYNSVASPDFWVFKSLVDVKDILGSMDWATDYATFQSDVPAMSLLFTSGQYDPQTVQARDALNAIFAGASATKAAILAASVRTASNIEKLFATTTTGPGGGNGSLSTQSAIAVFSGTIDRRDVRAAVAMIE